jgi:hypothetical protein
MDRNAREMAAEVERGEGRMGEWGYRVSEARGEAARLARCRAIPNVFPFVFKELIWFCLYLYFYLCIPCFDCAFLYMYIFADESQCNCIALTLRRELEETRGLLQSAEINNANLASTNSALRDDIANIGAQLQAARRDVANLEVAWFFFMYQTI